MQARGCAVIVPDLRGHGKSTQIKRGGDLITIDQATLRKGDIEAMVTQDLEAVKTFLMDRNNAGELNIEKLCVIGNEMGATVAVNWAVYDWHWRQLPNVKQGQDVKALVLISPPMNFHGIGIIRAVEPALAANRTFGVDPRRRKEFRGMDDAKRINTILGVARPKPPTDPKEVADQQDLFLSIIEGASLQGPNILNDKTILAQLDLVVGQFVEWRLMNKKFPWTDRKPAPLRGRKRERVSRPRVGGLESCWNSGFGPPSLGLGAAAKLTGFRASCPAANLAPSGVGRDWLARSRRFACCRRRAFGRCPRACRRFARCKSGRGTGLLADRRQRR